MGKLELRHFRAVHAVREHGTVSAAAQALGLTQPALSHQIAEAERRLGRALFNRSGRKVTLTTAGTLLASNADIILQEVDMAERNLQGDRDQAEIIRIGTYAYSCYRWLPAFLKKIKADLPHLEFELATDTAKLPVRSVSDGEVDIGITAGDMQARSISSTPLFDDELVAILPKSHRLSDRPYLEAVDFLDDPFITYSTQAEPGLEDELFWRPAGIRPRKFLRAGLTEAVIELVRAEFGLSILSRWAVVPYLENGDLVSIRLTQKGLKLRWKAISRRASANKDTVATITRQLQTWCGGHF